MAVSPQRDPVDIAKEAEKGQNAFVRTVMKAKPTPDQECGQGETGMSSSGCPVVGAGESGVKEADCPVISPDFDPSNMMPRTPNQASEGQSGPLGTERVASSIPTAATTRPQHQDTESNVWMYPSEQMFFNAMKRKGWQPNTQDMHSVVAIHNAVNERAWHEVMMWEQLHSNVCKEPKLKKFMGRPKDYSPKARLLNLLGYKLPFDRHDWVVSRCGKDVRYVIDFYNAAPLPSMPVALHLDVRPALDSPQALLDRLKVQAKWMFHGKFLGEK